MKIALRYLVDEDEKKFGRANDADWGGFAFAHYWESLANEDFHKYVKILPEFAEGLHMPEGHVPCTFLFAFNEDNELVGRTSIRHRLTENLLEVGGHIGYGVVPKFRRKGYATLILEESLNYVRENLSEIDQVLVTCDEGNIASQKTIEKNAGVLENIIDFSDGKRKMRFWIKI